MKSALEADIDHVPLHPANRVHERVNDRVNERVDAVAVTRSQRHRARLRVVWRGTILLSGLVTWAIARHSAELQSVLPACPFWSLTGFFCPGCGATRSTLALLHGDIDAALGWNPLWVLVLTLLVAQLALRAVRGAWVWDAPRRARIARALLIVVIAFGVARNIPVLPWCALSPAGSGCIERDEADAAGTDAADR